MVSIFKCCSTATLQLHVLHLVIQSPRSSEFHLFNLLFSQSFRNFLSQNSLVTGAGFLIVFGAVALVDILAVWFCLVLCWTGVSGFHPNILCTVFVEVGSTSSLKSPTAMAALNSSCISGDKARDDSFSRAVRGRRGVFSSCGPCCSACSCWMHTVFWGFFLSLVVCIFGMLIVV